MASNRSPAALETDWLPVGEEPHPLGSITQYSVLRHAGISVLSVYTGDIDSVNEPSTGMYVRDTRYLSLLRLTFGGVTPTLLDARTPETDLSAIFTNPAIRDPESDRVIPAQTLVVRRQRVIAESLLESLNVSNYGTTAALFQLRIEFDADFRDIFEVRGYERLSVQPPVHCDVAESSVMYVYTGIDNRERSTTVAFDATPTSLTAGQATFLLELRPRESRQICLEVSVDRPPTHDEVEAAGIQVRAHDRKWLAQATHIQTSHEGINAMLERSLMDVHALQTTTGDDRYLAAGVPWFDTLFGRDSLIAGLELMAFVPEVLREALIVLARYQADAVDPAHDATPGKIPHELRWGELANAGEVPFGRYYGSIDVTPLFIVAAGEYVRWTGDYALIRKLWPNIQRAMAWCRDKIANGVNGFIAYSRTSARGLENQGWKDSHDSMVWPDGTLVQPPIALIEVQGYMAGAFSAYAHMASALGDPSAAEAARDGPLFCERIDKVFGHEQLGYVMCLDANGRQVPTAASNTGHMLWSGIARRDLARIASNRMMEPDMFSGWGVRTLSSLVSGYNPLGYHVGSVWPHDNAMLLGGMRWFGFDEQAEELGSALIQMSLGFPEFRVPELFSGDARELRLVPTPYPVASRPQAWSAAAMPYVFSSLLGLRPGNPGQLAVVRPRLPMGIEWVRIRNLRFGNGALDLTFRRQRRHISVEVEQIHGHIEVVLSEVFPGGRAIADADD
jgi:glycogen debranching enzyme